MSFDEQPDAPIHGECAAEIERLQRALNLAEVGEFAGQVGQGHLGELVDELRADNARLKARVERLRGALKTASGWCFDMTDDSDSIREWGKRADWLLEVAGDMEA